MCNSKKEYDVIIKLVGFRPDSSIQTVSVVAKNEDEAIRLALNEVDGMTLSPEILRVSTGTDIDIVRDDILYSAERGEIDWEILGRICIETMSDDSIQRVRKLL